MTAPSLAYQDAMNGIAILYDALSNAENELDKLKNTWIKCSERMPPFVGEQSKPVLVWGDGYDEPEIGIFHEYDGWDAWGVTHWQPLPPPPEDE